MFTNKFMPGRRWCLTLATVGLFGTAAAAELAPDPQVRRFSLQPFFTTNPDGYLFEKLLGEGARERYGFSFHGIAQGGVIYNDSSSENVFPSGFLNNDEGFNLNRVDLYAERRLTTNIIPRIGPIPRPKPNNVEWGFALNARYGSDTARTFGFDDEWGLNEGRDESLLLPQWYLESYLPVLGGTAFIVGSWFGGTHAEIGLPVDPPTPFYTHSYSFLYSPAKHVGGLAETILPTANEFGTLSIGLGIVEGWSNLQDNNDDLSYLGILRWRSSDFRTWLDVENIVGNEQSEEGITDQRPFTAVSSTNDQLFRVYHSVTLNHAVSAKLRFIANAEYGYQEGGDVVADQNNPPGFLITQDSEWYGFSFSSHYLADPNLQLSWRAEWFRDDDGAHFLLPPGNYYSLTANVAWKPLDNIRIRPEIRYDWYDGPGKPFAGERPAIFSGEKKEQFVFSFDFTVVF